MLAAQCKTVGLLCSQQFLFRELAEFSSGKVETGNAKCQLSGGRLPYKSYSNISDFSEAKMWVFTDSRKS